MPYLIVGMNQPPSLAELCSQSLAQNPQHGRQAIHPDLAILIKKKK